MKKLTCLVLAALTLGLPGLARATDEAPVVDACDESAGQVPQLGSRTCRSLQQLARGGAQLCRYETARTGSDAAACDELDGRDLSNDDISAFETSWVARALELQRELAAHVPLRLNTLAHTHNSYNSAAYDPTLSRLDHNQLHTITDQLRMGVRAVEIDIHWAPNAHTVSLAPTTCHANKFGTPIHVGCTTEGTLREALTELRAWLDDNPGEFVLLYLENALDDDPAAHDIAAADIEDLLGDLVERPPAQAEDPCVDLPVFRTPADILANGHQVLITGNCGPGAWRTWVHPRGDNWSEGSSGPGDDYPAAPDCLDRGRVDYDAKIIRTWEDATWLSHMASGQGSDVTPTEVGHMIRCGMNLVGFDLLRPNDGRLEALVWSWAPNQPATTPGYAHRGNDGRFRAVTNGGTSRRFACRLSDGSWAVTTASGAWSAGTAACLNEHGGTFTAPRTARENLLLGQAAVAAGVTNPLWLGYRSTDGTTWTAG